MSALLVWWFGGPVGAEDIRRVLEAPMDASEFVWAFGFIVVLAGVIVGAFLLKQHSPEPLPGRESIPGREYFVAQGRVRDALERIETGYEGHLMTVEPFPTRRAAEIWYLTTMALRCSSGCVVRRQFVSGNWVDVESWPIKETVQS